MHNSGEIAPRDREGVFAFAVIAWPAMTVLQSFSPWLLKKLNPIWMVHARMRVTSPLVGEVGSHRQMRSG
ncbi:hypothetical protein SAMN05443248_7535 [Bradyrhizobium erythrophlei]|jgi:hypothetical protein|uniref:Uncharacterized protein n=1 Tax=Bradyrhizobium erythrophlei TaxID=1437360 RepID=A0A1M5XQP4_9BRAD|nr:hypothetical protein SAMN05443248_7535 [Bradyrhizobium erythrophlei]